MSLTQLPDNLPVPQDDGATDHLTGCVLPQVTLMATNNRPVNLLSLPGVLVIYIYPMTGRPDTPLPDNWNEIPGARGCTPQSCGFRDNYAELQKLGANVFGLSTQSTEYQLEAKQRLHLPFEMLSDTALHLKELLALPTFEVAGMALYKRLTLIIHDGVIKKVFYPVFPSSENAAEVISWLNASTVNAGN